MYNNKFIDINVLINQDISIDLPASYSNLGVSISTPRNLHQTDLALSTNFLGGVRLNGNRQSSYVTVPPNTPINSNISVITVLSTGSGSASSNRATRLTNLNVTLTYDQTNAKLIVSMVGTPIGNIQDLNTSVIISYAGNE
jgi:hypothetical protein